MLSAGKQSDDYVRMLCRLCYVKSGLVPVRSHSHPLIITFAAIASVNICLFGKWTVRSEEVKN